MQGPRFLYRYTRLFSQRFKTVQGSMGHATAAFTLDVYGHVAGQMKRASAARMEKFIRSVSG